MNIRLSAFLLSVSAVAFVAAVDILPTGQK